MVTFAASGTDAFDLEDAVNGTLGDAVVRGTQAVLRSVLGLGAASRASSAGPKAFKQATKYLVSNMLKSITKKIEIQMLYGQVGYATLGAQAATNTILIPDAEWAPGIWGGSEGMPIEQRDALGVLVKSMKVVSVNFETRAITVDGVATAVTAGDVLWHKSAYGNEFAGIHKIITNTTTIFGINAANYALFKGNVYDAQNSVLSFAKIQSAVSKAVEKGLEGDVKVVLNPEVWADVMNDQAGLRKYDQSYSTTKLENGAMGLEFYSQNGSMELIPSIHCKRGYAYIISLEEMVRIGSTDITFNRPGAEGQFFKDLENSAGYEMRAYTDQALFCHAPARNTIIINIA